MAQQGGKMRMNQWILRILFHTEPFVSKNPEDVARLEENHCSMSASVTKVWIVPQAWRRRGLSTLCHRRLLVWNIQNPCSNMSQYPPKKKKTYVWIIGFESANQFYWCRIYVEQFSSSIMFHLWSWQYPDLPTIPFNLSTQNRCFKVRASSQYGRQQRSLGSNPLNL